MPDRSSLAWPFFEERHRAFAGEVERVAKTLPEGAGPDVDAALSVRQALAELPPEQSRPIVQMTFQGLTAQEIATSQGLPLGTVKTRVRRGLRRLGEKLGVRDG